MKTNKISTVYSGIVLSLSSWGRYILFPNLLQHYLSPRLLLPRDKGKLQSVFLDRNKLSNFPFTTQFITNKKPFSAH